MAPISIEIEGRSWILNETLKLNEKRTRKDPKYNQGLVVERIDDTRDGPEVYKVTEIDFVGTTPMTRENPIQQVLLDVKSEDAASFSSGQGLVTIKTTKGS